MNSKVDNISSTKDESEISAKTAKSPSALTQSEQNLKAASTKVHKTYAKRRKDKDVPDSRKDKNDHSETDDSSHEMARHPKDLVSVIIPVALCMIFVVVMTIVIMPLSSGQDKTYMALTPFYSKDASAGTVAWQTLANVGILIAVVVAMTFIVVGLYLCRCYAVLMVLIALPVFLVNYFTTSIYVAKLLLVYNVSLDYVTLAFSIFNFGTVGVLSILGKGPKILQQAYLVYMCGIMAILYVQHMPDWTVWAFLGALAVWDLIAVLSPCGPLGLLVKAVQEREDDFMPAMVYSTMIVSMAERSKSGQESSHEGKQQEKDHKKSKEQSKGTDKDDAGKGSMEKNSEHKNVRLGLGDFVFYSVLIGKAAETSLTTSSSEYVDWITILACYAALLMGLIFTIMLLILYKRALPALPVSIAFGLVFYFSSTHVISPFMGLANVQQVFI